MAKPHSDAAELFILIINIGLASIPTAIYAYLLHYCLTPRWWFFLKGSVPVVSTLFGGVGLLFFVLPLILQWEEENRRPYRKEESEAAS